MTDGKDIKVGKYVYWHNTWYNNKEDRIPCYGKVVSVTDTHVTVDRGNELRIIDRRLCYTAKGFAMAAFDEHVKKAASRYSSNDLAFEPGETVWFLKDEKIQQGVIVSVGNEYAAIAVDGKKEYIFGVLLKHCYRNINACTEAVEHRCTARVADYKMMINDVKDLIRFLIEAYERTANPDDAVIIAATTAYSELIAQGMIER